MSRNKKVVIAGALAAIVLTASIGGVAMARAGTYSPAKPAAANQEVSANSTQQTLLGRVAEILGIDQAELEAAVKQAKQEQQLQTIKNRLDRFVAAGRITQEQAEEFLAWLQSRPDLTSYQETLRQWQQSRPDVPLPGVFGGKGMRVPMHRFGAMGGRIGGGMALPSGGSIQ
jgi:hypothetical protein